MYTRMTDNNDQLLRVKLEAISSYPVPIAWNQFQITGG